ncbi:MAG: site-specific integrase [Candidatus Methanoperedens sp.]|nr:site-specific integrase [Candidatus Methanoperedens sp.]
MSVKIRERPRASGIWWVFIDHLGKRKAKKIGRDIRIAQEVARIIEAKMLLGELNLDRTEKSKIPTLKEYVDGWHEPDESYQIGWYEKEARLSLKNSTFRSYRSIIDYHLLPAIGSIPINEITPRIISDFIRSKIKGGLRSNSAKNIKNCLSAILRHAVNPDGFLMANPARSIPVPKPEGEKALREPDPFTWDERKVFENTYVEHYPRYYALILCGLRTGLRIGELLALQWPDVDFYQRMILVQRNISRGKITTPKSSSGKRFVRMTSQLVQVLKQHRMFVMEEALLRGWGEVPEWMFFNDYGQPINYGNFIHRVWDKAMTKSQLRRRTPHDMRHTYALCHITFKQGRFFSRGQ